MAVVRIPIHNACRNRYYWRCRKCHALFSTLSAFHVRCFCRSDCVDAVRPDA